MSVSKLFMVILVQLFFLSCFSQEIDSSKISDSRLTNNFLNLPGRFFLKLNGKTDLIEKRLHKQSQKYLQKLADNENKLKRKLYKLDSNAKKNLFLLNTQEQYASYLQKIKHDSIYNVNNASGDYEPYTDSLGAMLSFLYQNPQLIKITGKTPPDIQFSLSKLQGLQAKMQDADQVQKFIQQRKDQIKQYLLQFTHLPPGITKIYTDYNKDLYYYNEQVRVFKESLNDPDKMLKESLAVLNKLPAFETFMKNNSVLAGLFPVSPNFGTPMALAGLQTRDQFTQLIQSQLSGANVQQALAGSVKDAQSQLNRLQQKVMAYGNGAAGVDMSGFKPDEQKTKPFLKRLEYSFNIQSQHASFYFPKTTDFGLSAGYKLKDNVAGVGVSYKMSWGNDFRHISMKNQGVGLRSFIDMKFKRSIYISGGFEYNYQPVINTQTNSLSYWQKSGLIGISKIVSMKTKLFKKTKIQLLWDFLSYQQVPRAQPVKFRVGYNF